MGVDKYSVSVGVGGDYSVSMCVGVGDFSVSMCVGVGDYSVSVCGGGWVEWMRLVVGILIVWCIDKWLYLNVSSVTIWHTYLRMHGIYGFGNLIIMKSLNLYV